MKHHCKYCDYFTDNTSYFSKHKNTKKHARNMAIEKEKREKEIKANVLPKKIGKNNKKKQKKKVRKVKQKVYMDNDYKELIKDYYDNASKGIVRRKSYEGVKKELIDPKIVRGFTLAFNLDDIIDKKLTDEIKDNIRNEGVVEGFYNFLEEKCLRPIEIRNRAFSCISMNKREFILRKDNKWVIDNNGDEIINIIRPYVYDIFDPDRAEDQETKIKYCSELLRYEVLGQATIIEKLVSTQVDYDMSLADLEECN